jgi:hypothetical protein
MRIRCCSFSISPQAHKSFGSPHVEQISAIMLSRRIALGVYKIFKSHLEKPTQNDALYKRSAGHPIQDCPFFQVDRIPMDTFLITPA